MEVGIEEAAFGYWVREPFPSIATGTDLRGGKFDGLPLTVVSRMNEGGVVFSDGIEQDFVTFDWGRRVVMTPASQSLQLVVT